MRHRAVDNHQLAVIAQIEAGDQANPEDRLEGHGDLKLDASLFHAFPERGFHEFARAEVVGGGADGDPARGGADERLGDLAAGAVIEPDVEQQADAFAGGVDIGDERGMGLGLGGHEARAIAAHRLKAVDRGGEAEGFLLRAGDFGETVVILEDIRPLGAQAA